LNPTGDTTGVNRSRADSGAGGNRSTTSDTLGYGRNPNQSRDSLQGNQPRMDTAGMSSRNQGQSSSRAGTSDSNSYSNLPNKSRDSLEGNTPRVSPNGQEGGVSGAAGVTGAANLGSADRAFIQKAGEGGVAEVVLGCIAKQRASNPQVKQFAQRMIDDHSRANQQLMLIARAKGVALPNGLEGEFKETADRLSRLSGAEFDRAYMSDMVKDHQKDAAEFEREATGAQDPDVKSFASQTLPIIRQHLDLARQVSSSVSSGSHGNSQ
jgi:putative membrane protein